jgi:hypothetical protein
MLPRIPTPHFLVLDGCTLTIVCSLGGNLQKQQVTLQADSSVIPYTERARIARRLSQDFQILANSMM